MNHLDQQPFQTDLVCVGIADAQELFECRESGGGFAVSLEDQLQIAAFLHYFEDNDIHNVYKG